jgi:precorrin-2 dehydrogenase / sirohydrochlorin ferrochelatase
MPSYYPVFVNLQGKRCLVVGGGEVATRKVHGLLEAEARVVVVSPQLSKPLADLTMHGVIEYQPRPFHTGDVLDCALVIGATDQPEVNMAVYEAAQEHHVWVNIVDTPDACDFIAPAIVRRGALQIAISTGGQSPTLAKRIRMQLEELYGSEYTRLLETLGRERQRIRQLIRDPELRKAYYERLVDAALSKLGSMKSPPPAPALHPLPCPDPGAEIVDQRDDDQRHQQKGEELVVVKEADGHIDVAANPACTHHPDDGGGANIDLPAIQRVGDQLR